MTYPEILALYFYIQEDPRLQSKIPELDVQQVAMNRYRCAFTLSAPIGSKEMELMMAACIQIAPCFAISGAGAEATRWRLYDPADDLPQQP